MLPPGLVVAGRLAILDRHKERDSHQPSSPQSTGGQKVRHTLIPRSTPVLDFRSHCHERLLNVRGILSRSLEKGNANFICKGLQRKHTTSHQNQNFTAFDFEKA
jgi:hypothetical protein